MSDQFVRRHIGMRVLCFGVGCLKTGSAGTIIEIDHRKIYPYRIKIDGKRGSLWYSSQDFNIISKEEDNGESDNLYRTPD